MIRLLTLIAHADVAQSEAQVECVDASGKATSVSNSSQGGVSPEDKLYMYIDTNKQSPSAFPTEWYGGVS